MPGVSVSEIHAYPLRPDGFEEPLFRTTESKRAVAEHLLEAPWLRRASELRESTGESAHALREAIEIKKTLRGQVELLRTSQARRPSWKRKLIVKVLECWRDVRGWWDEDSHTDRLVFRVLLSGGIVAELAKERSGGWFLVGVAD